MRMTAEKAGKKGLYILAGIAIMVYVLLFGGNAMVSYAAEIRTITDAKIRSEADTGSAQVGSAPQGTTLSVLGETQGADNNTWYQVSVNGQTGYIRKDLTEDVDGGSEASGTVAQTDITSGVIGGSSATVRKGPSTSAGKAAGVEAGATVKITGEALGDDGSTWYQVDVDGQSGFIRSDLFDEAGFAREGGEEGIPEGEGEDGGEETPEEPAEGGEEEPAEPEGGTRVVNVLSSKVIPDGVDIEDMEINADTLAGWVSDEYYLLKTKTEEGQEDYYIYILSSGKLEKLKLAGSGSLSSVMEGSGKFIVIGVGVLVVILIIICIMLAVKLRGYQGYDGYGGGRGYDDDDEEEYDDEDDEEYDDDDEEEYDDEDDEEYDDDDEEEYDDDEYDEDDEEDERPVRKRRWSPKNFLSRRDEYEEEEEDEEDEDDGYDDEDDEEYLDDDDFEFEFLNMDGKDDF